MNSINKTSTNGIPGRNRLAFRSGLATGLLSLALLSSAALAAHAQQYQMFLKLDGIEGESKDSTHFKEIDIFGFGQAIQSPPAAGGKPGLGDLTLIKQMDKSSPRLTLACAQGIHIATAVLTVRSTAGSKVEFYQIKLTDVVITSVKVNTPDESTPRPLENVTLNYAKIEWIYTPLKPDGNKDNPVVSSWDLSTNTGR